MVKLMINGNVLIFGSGGIGSALAKRCCQQDSVATVTLVWQHNAPTVDEPKLTAVQADVFNEQQLGELLTLHQPDFVISTLGTLHTDEQQPEKRLADFEADWFIDSHAVNAAAAVTIAKAIDGHTRRRDRMTFAVLSARVGSITDNRSGGWFSYRSSKASLNMAIKTVAIEWRRTRPLHCALLLHPGTVKTPLSAPFSHSTPPEKLFSTEQSADYLLAQLAAATPANSGQFLAWDGSIIPW
jgi:NAD(P)-dependent dehydrogenase (short-subunit alcohol dehydrogenase family)